MDEYSKEKIKYSLELRSDLLSAFHERFKSITTPLSIFIALNTGLASFSLNYEARSYTISFVVLSLGYILLLLINHHFVQDTVHSASRAKTIAKRPVNLEKEFVVTNEEFGFLLKTGKDTSKNFRRIMRMFDLLIGANLFLVALFWGTLLITT